MSFITSGEGIATMLVVLAMLLKLLINRNATMLHIKQTVVSVPSEITFLVVGFLLSAALVKNEKNSINTIITYVIIAFIILVIQYALEKWLDDKLSGKWSFKIWATVVFMFILSAFIYVVVVFGGE